MYYLSQRLTLHAYLFSAFTIEPPTDVYYDEQTSVLSFRSPSTNYCVHVELYRNGEWSTYEGCENALGGSVELNQGGVQAARVKLCLKRRQQICSTPESAVIGEYYEGVQRGKGIG